MFLHRQIAARCVRRIKVDIPAKNQPAFVRLADIKMPHAKADHMIDARLQPLSHKSLQYVALYRQAQSGHRCNLTGTSSHHNRNLICPDHSTACLHPSHLAIFRINPCDFTVLHQINPAFIGPARIAPSHSVVTRSACPALQQAAINWEPGVVKIKIWHQFTQRIAVQQFRIITAINHRIPTPHFCITLGIRVKQHNLSPRGMHNVIVQFLRQALPQL